MQYKFLCKNLYLVIAAIMLGLSAQGFSLSHKKIVPDEEFLKKAELLGEYLLTASDEKAELTPQKIMSGEYDLMFKDTGGNKAASYGANRPWPHWGYFAIDNLQNETRNLFLEVGYVATDYVTVYQVTESGEILSEQKLGDKVPFSERQIKYRHPVFDLKLTPGVNHIIVKIETTSIVIFEFSLHTDKGFKNAKFQEMMAVGVMLGGILVIFLYNLFLFVSTRDSNYGRYIIYVGSYFLFALAYYGILPYFAFSEQADPPLSGWDIYVLIDLITVGSILFTIGFLNLKKESPIFYWACAFCAIVAAVNAGANVLVLQGSIPALKSVTILISLLMGICLVASGARMIIKGYFPAVYFTLAWTFVIGGNTLVLLASSGVLDRSFLTIWGQLIGANTEMILLSFALGARINLIKHEKLKAERAMLKEAEEKKKLQAELISSQEENIKTLDIKVKERTRDIREILTNIKQGIFTFRDDMKFGEEYSDYLRDLLHGKDLKGLSLEDALLKNTNLSENEISQLLTALEFSFGQDAEFGWDANKGCLIREFELNLDNQQSYIEADWGPILNDDGEVEKVLVSMRDVTEIRALKAKAMEKEQEARMLLEMLSNDLGKTEKFLKRSLQSWNDIDQLLIAYLNDVETNYVALFREYHTLKGNARSLGFKGISDSIHNLETELKDIKESYTPEKLEDLRTHSNDCRRLIRTYHHIFVEKFARFMHAETAVKGIPFEEYVEKNLLTSIERIAKDLDKPVPLIDIINPQGFLIMNDEIEDLAHNILNHLIRNSIDHGIENAETRKAAGKKAFGTIHIEIQIDVNKMATITYRDDGRGLNLSRIYDLGVEKGLLSETASPEDLVEVIFRPGFSTAQKTSMISGRGIGMDAVRHYSTSIGASFIIELDNPIDEEMMKRIREGRGEDIFMTFNFRSEVYLKQDKSKLVRDAS